ncbi:hypothetical protein GCM10009123_17660 [Kangiella japonica]|uniref:Uncharacterized protein n=1 Tax=Kangiella japonica TaxID=647384 RepID=A0ABN0T2Y4_9GAMM
MLATWDAILTRSLPDVAKIRALSVEIRAEMLKMGAKLNKAPTLEVICGI